MSGARIFRGVHPMPKAGNFLLIRQHAFYVLDRIFSRLIKVKYHAHDLLVCATVEWTFQRADRAGDGRVHVRKRGGSYTRGESRGVQLVVSMENESYIKRFFRCR